MGKIDSKIIDKIEIIKQIIISRSLLRNHRSSLKWTEMEIEGNDEVGVVELILYVEVTEINCDDCSFEPEVISHSFQDLMKQVHRKSDVQAQDARLMLFDIVPLTEFKAGASAMGQKRRSAFLRENFSKLFADSGCIDIIAQKEFDLDVFTDEIEFKDYNKAAVAEGYEGIMIKDPNGKWEGKRSVAWLKQKPFIEVSLEITAVEEGTGRNLGRLGAVICEGVDDGKNIRVNVGSGFTDKDRDEFWECKVDGQVIEVRADAITQNQDGTYSLRFPRFMRFRGFKTGEKI